MPRSHTLAPLLVLLSLSCSTTVGDLDDLQVDDDACDPNGRTAQGTDFDLEFRGLLPHVNQRVLMAVVAEGSPRNVEAMMVLSTLDDADLRINIPKLLPAGNLELAFWADGPPVGFNPLPESGDDNGAPIDHQWTRPICPNGRMVFTHDTPFQDVTGPAALGLTFRFHIPLALRRQVLFDNFRMWARAIKLSDSDLSVESQTRAYFRWAPFVALPGTSDIPEQREPPEFFQVGDDVIGQRRRGTIDEGSFYRIEFVIDADHDGETSDGDFMCSFERVQAFADEATGAFEFEPDLDKCRLPDDFDPLTFQL